MRRILIAALLIASAQAQFRTTRYPNQGHTTAPYDFWYGKDGSGPLRISGPDAVTSPYWLKWPKAGAAGCMIAGIADAEGAYPLALSPCGMVINAHWNGSAWIADDTGGIVGRLSGTTFTLDSFVGATPGAAVSFSTPALITADLTNRYIQFAKINGHLLSSVSNTIKIGDHSLPNYFTEGAFTTIYSDAILPEVDGTSTIGSAAHPFGSINQGAAGTLTTDGIVPLVGDTSPVGSALKPMGDSYFHGLTVGAGGISGLSVASGQTLAIASGGTLSVAAGASLAISGSTAFGGTANMSGTLDFTGTVKAGGAATFSGVCAAGVTIHVTNGLITSCP